MANSARCCFTVTALLFSACGPIDTGSAGSGSATSADGGSGSVLPAGGAPALSILSPLPGATCAVDKHDPSCKVLVAITGATLAPPGRCGSARADCGHIDFYIDGAGCGAPNAQAWVTSFAAQPGRCPSLKGPHRFSAELRNDDGRLLASTPAVDVRVTDGDGDED